MIDCKKLDEYSLKIREISKYQEEANKYKRLSILGGLFAGLKGILCVFSLIDGTKFIGVLSHFSMMCLALTFMLEEKNHQNECEHKIFKLKYDIQEYKKI